MMDDLISRQAALDIVFDFAEAPHNMYQKIRELPSAEKHGRWVDAKPKSKKVGKVCSSCGNEAYWDSDYGQQLFDYCPWCGAKMERSEE